MDREILFRAKLRKQTGNGEWIFGSLITLDSDSDLYFIVPEYRRASTLTVRELVCYSMEPIDKDTICQFTGLYDNTRWEQISKNEQEEFLERWNFEEWRKNTKEDWKGRKIFEGDIVKIPLFTPDIMVIGFIEGAFCLVNSKKEYVADIHYIHHADVNQTDIIGNIIDNPDLIGG